MKRFSIFLCLLLALAGCRTEENRKAPTAEDCVWQMTTVQSVEAEGAVIAWGPGWDGAPKAGEPIALYCTAAEGTLKLVDKTNQQNYSGTYSQTQADRQTCFYEVTIGETEGIAVSSMTTYQDESQTPTFIIRVDDHVLNFFPAEE